MDERLLDADIEILEDGFAYFFVENKGALSSEYLRFIADYLDKKNKGVVLHINEYFDVRGLKDHEIQELTNAIRDELKPICDYGMLRELISQTCIHYLESKNLRIDRK